jgi:branched-chain amino acid transport system ATP-binding protein
MSPDGRARLGLGRSYQKTNIFPNFTAFENCRLAAQSRAPRVLHLVADAETYGPTRAAAEQALIDTELTDRAGVVASALSHGEQRQLEIAMALATRPRLLLLDEPVAGMGVEESQRMVGLLRELRGSHTLVLVEHDMDVVFALADRIAVLVYGRVIASGAPEAIRLDPEVRRAYLGEEVTQR